MTKTRRAILIILTLVVSLRILYICIGGEVDKAQYKSRDIDLTDAVEYPCVSLTEKFVGREDRLYGIDLFLAGIDDDRTGNITVQIESENTLLYQTDIALDNVKNQDWKFVYINIGLESGKEYELHLTSSDTCVEVPQVMITTRQEASPEVLESYSEGSLLEGEIAIQYRYLLTPAFSERLIMSSIWLLLWLIFYSIVLNIDWFLSKISIFYQLCCNCVHADRWIIFIEFLSCLIILNCSGIDFQNPTKILFYIISFCSTIKIKEKRDFVGEISNTKVKRIVLCLLYIYAAFALVGQRILIYPLSLKIRIAGVVVFVVTVLWFIPVIQTLLYILDWLTTKVFSTNRTMNKVRFIAWALTLLLVPAIYNLYANNPGISSYDTRSCMIYSAHNLHGMNDWHPAFYCMVLGAILKVWDSTYAVIIMQYFFWSYVFLELLLYLRKKEMRDSVLMAAALFTGINAANFLHLNTIWKDIPYTISLLWVLVLLSKLSFDYEEYRKKWYIYLEMVVALTGVFFYRKNGIVPFIVISVMMIIILRKSMKIWFTVFITAAVILTIRGPVYDFFEVQSSDRDGAYIGLGQDILGVYYANGELSQDTLSMINVMTSYNNAEYSYTPTWSNQSYNLDVEPKEFILNYIDTFMKNPVLMLRAVVAREDAIWNIYAGADSRLGCVNSYGTMDGQIDWNDYYPRRKYNALYTRMAMATDYTANTQWIAAIEWRCGFFTLLGLAAFIYAYMRYGIRKYIIILAPVIGQILGLVLSTGWSDFRYFWPLNLMNFASILLIMALREERK